jgi:hypothetical protein
MTMPLLTTKLYIPTVRRRERVVPRPRLIEWLNESLRYSMKLIDIFGKRRTKVNDLRKPGGIAALYCAAAYVFAIVGYLLIVGDVGDVDPLEQVAILVDNQAFLYVLNLFVYIVFGVFLAILALALYERLKAGSPALMQIATAIGLFWACLLIASGMVANVGMGNVVDLYDNDPAQAATVWLAIDSVVLGLGGEFEFLGGLWVLLVSLIALWAGELPRALNYLGVVIAVAALITVVPALSDVGLIFGLGHILWFIWLGIDLLRSAQEQRQVPSSPSPAV